MRRNIDRFDPTQSPESWILSALFEPLVEPHPETMTPIAGLATHYRIEDGGKRYTFYLRGHSAPRGMRLAGPDSLPAEFSRGRAGAPFGVSARWSDGQTITADDCVYSWRRFFDPKTANPDAYTFFCVAGAEEVSTGMIPPERLAVRTLDRFAFEVDLVKPAPHFLMLSCIVYPTPRHAIERARHDGREASWTDPARLVTSGPFQLKEYRPHERTLVARNPYYFDAGLVEIEEIEFSAADGAGVLNLFRSGLAESREGRVLPLQLAPGLKGQAALHVRPACACHAWRFSANRAPWDNVLLRYALNMATDKEAIARFLGMGQRPAKTRVPPLPGYTSPADLPIEINGRLCDVLAFDPRAARELWESAAGSPGLRLTIHYPARVDSRLLAEIQQDQWMKHLGLIANLQAREPAAYNDSVFQQGDFLGVAEDSYIANIPDPYDLLSLYLSGYPSWSDPAFDATLNTATSITDPALRMKKMAECEADLLRGMPLIPLYFDTWVYLERPDLHGMGLSPLGVPAFKYGWIEETRRPS